MKRYLTVIPVLLCLLLTDCTRRPEERRSSADGRDRTQQYSRERKNSKNQSNSLASKVQELADEVETAYKRNRVSTENMAHWAQLYSEYYIEYNLSAHRLTDEECASIEFHFGQIAGHIYQNTISPVLKELNDISNGIEEYRQRSKRWEGALEEGFRSATDAD